VSLNDAAMCPVISCVDLYMFFNGGLFFWGIFFPFFWDFFPVFWWKEGARKEGRKEGFPSWDSALAEPSGWRWREILDDQKPYTMF
jgi:hypothetical protein